MGSEAVAASRRWWRACNLPGVEPFCFAKGRPMKIAISTFICVFGAICLTGGARAQEGLATSGGVQGHNTIQQAPSGGRVAGGASNLGGTVGRGEPTAQERQTEKHNNDVTQICKGC